MLGRSALSSIACAVLCWGCATAPGLHLDDPEFATAERCLRESAERITAPKTLAPDEVLFLQAESFYYFRSELKRTRSAWSYFAQSAAAFTDFAPLTVIAASQGSFDLRLRAYDGAARLYGTLASRYPLSGLRPLALYRLGWACRSTSEQGYPCRSAESFGALAREYPATPLASLVPDALRAPHRSLDRATAWSLLPGAGQIYAGEALNGAVRLSVAAGFSALTLVPIVGMVQSRKVGCFPTALSLLGIVGLQVTYTTSYQDAQRAVLDFNERQEAAFEAAHPATP